MIFTHNLIFCLQISSSNTKLVKQKSTLSCFFTFLISLIISSCSSEAFFSQDSIAFSSVIPTEVPLRPLSTVDNFPESEVLNRNTDDIEKGKQELMHNVNVEAVTKYEFTSAQAESKKLEEIHPIGTASSNFEDTHLGSLSGLPNYCKRKGAMCQHVDSTLIPNENQRVKRSNEDENDKKNSKEENKDGKDKTNKDDDHKGDDCDQKVKIDAFGGNYTLCLFIRPFKDEPIVKNSYDILNVSIFNTLNVSDDVSIRTFDLYSAMGHVIEETYASVSGYVFENRFYGTVYLKDSVHYLEPHNRKSRDLRIFGNGLKTLIHRETIQHKKESEKDRKKRYASKGEENKKGKKKPIQRRTCDITIVADHLFFHEIGEGSVEKTVLQMLWHVKEANALFQTEDFDEDGRSECIGLTVSEITIFKSEESNVNLLTGKYSIPEDFLKRFSRYNFDGFCLGVLFTNRIFDDLVLGLSWRGNPKPDGVGGICQHRVRIKSDKNAYSFNALFISLKSSQESRIPLRMGVLNLVHELMHSFGAKHDPEPSEDAKCTPEDKWVNGRFLMSKYSNDGHKLNHMILSPCTKSLVKMNLKSDNRVACLVKEKDPFCGDGIVQDEEECDCGSIFQCIATRSSCIPPEGKGKREKECKEDPNSKSKDKN